MDPEILLAAATGRKQSDLVIELLARYCAAANMALQGYAAMYRIREQLEEAGFLWPHPFEEGTDGPKPGQSVPGD